MLRTSVVTCPSCDDERACTDHDRADVRCARCAGTGSFITGSVNGVPTGPGGPCFRCGGKGFHTWHDRIRNRAYNRHRRY